MLWIGLGCLILICIIIIFSRIYIEVTFKYHQGKQIINVRVRLYGMSILKKYIDLDDVENKDQWKISFKGKSFKQTLEYFQKVISDIFQAIDDLTMAALVFLKRLHVHQLQWITRFGTGEASSTGMAAGGIWTVKGSIIGFLDAMSHFECEPKITVEPHFQRKYVDSEIDCIVSIRIGQAMYALIKVIRKSSLKKEAYI